MAKNKKSRVSKENKSSIKSSPPKKSTQTKEAETEEKKPPANEPVKKISHEDNELQPVEIKDTLASSVAHDHEIHEVSSDTNCKCMQKKPGGKYFCFRLVQGRWVQSSAIPFDTKEFCEEICC